MNATNVQREDWKILGMMCWAYCLLTTCPTADDMQSKAHGWYSRMVGVWMVWSYGEDLIAN